jgi:regulator of RNase E activity RraA
VLVVPRGIEDEVLAGAAAKRSTEFGVLDSIAGGMSSSEALDRFGVL